MVKAKKPERAIKFVKTLIGWVIILILLILFFIFVKNSSYFYSSFVEPYQDYWNFLWIGIPLIAIIFVLYKRRDSGKKLKGMSSILDGVIGGLVAAFILELRTDYWVFQITGFLLTLIVIILRVWYSRENKNG